MGESRHVGRGLYRHCPRPPYDTYPARRDGGHMTTITMNEIIHAAVRRDLARTETALRSFPDGDRARAEGIKRAWDFLNHTLHDHHVGEEEHVWPYLRSLSGD